MKKMQIFLSYCWSDSKVADDIVAYFKNNVNVELHRDVFDIKRWGSIKEYMQSISDMDFIVLLVSDSYLKSANCMYEVLEVMRDRSYKDKIFLAIIDSEIYKPIVRARYVKYWENEFNELDKVLKEISIQNLGKLNEDLKRCQDISSNIAEFLDVVADMNNPEISEVSMNIEQKLFEKGLLNENNVQIVDKNDLFTTLGIQKTSFFTEPTDLEVNQFIKEAFNYIITLFSELCSQYQKASLNVNISMEQIDSRTVIYQFYKNGAMIKGLKLFISNMFGRRESIGVSDATISLGGSNNSWNGMYEVKVNEGEMKLCATMSMGNKEKLMTSQEVVADIWENYIKGYLER